MAESFSREILRHAPQKEGGWKILCDLPPVFQNKRQENAKHKTHKWHGPLTFDFISIVGVGKRGEY